MKFPAPAFAVGSDEQIPAGTVFYQEGEWFFATVVGSSNEEATLAIQLTGDQAGHARARRMLDALYVVAPYRWQPTFAYPSDITSSGSISAAIQLGDQPYIWAQDRNHSWAAFTLEGRLSTTGGASRYGMRFPNWDGWLVDKSGCLVGGRPLFEVRRATPHE